MTKEWIVTCTGSVDFTVCPFNFNFTQRVNYFDKTSTHDEKKKMAHNSMMTVVITEY